MSADSSIMREYLVALGFQVDKPGMKNFSGTLGSLNKTALVLGKTILGVAAAATAMVGVFTVQMEKMYYSSKRANSTVGNMKALEFGARSVGLTGEQMRGSLEGMARALRSNPGLTGLLNHLGVAVQGRDMSDVLTDMVGQLKKMPFYVAERYANMFGMDSDTLFMLADGLDKLKEAQRLRKEMAADAGLDSDKAAASAVAYSNAIRQLSERLGILKDVLSIKLLPGFLEFTQMLDNNLGALTKWVGKFETLGDAVSSLFSRKGSERTGEAKSMFEWFTTHRTDRPAPKPDAGPKMSLGDKALKAARQAIPESWRRPENRNGATYNYPEAVKTAPNGAPAASKAAGNTQGAAELFARLEKQYALPEGSLDRVWKTESGRGKNMLGPMTKYGQAKGHFQFMDPTAKEYGVTDPNDLTQSATGAAKYLSKLQNKYGGDFRKATAAYNWGQGNLDRYGLGRAPKETRDYMDKTAGPAVEQNNSIVIHGVKDPDKAATAVADVIRTNNADLIRNMTPRVN